MSEPERPVERRRHPRRFVLYPGTVRCGDSRGDCEVVDLSATGAKIRLEEEFECTSPLTLTFDIGEFEGEVMWQNDEFVGIKFDESPREVATTIEKYFFRPMHPKDLREFVRTSVMWAAKLHLKTQTVNCVVLNISPDGAKIRLENIPDEMSPLTLHVDRIGDLPGEVVWQEGAMIGISFRESPSVVARRIEPALKPSPDEPGT